MHKKQTKPLYWYRYFLFLGLITIGAGSCKKDPAPNSPGNDNVARLIKVTSGDEKLQLTYGNNNLPVRVITSLLSEDEDVVAFTVRYRADKKIQDLTGDNGLVITPEYDGGIPIRAQYHQDNIHQGYVNYHIENGQYKEATMYRKAGNDFIPSLSFRFTYTAAGNISETVVLAENGTPNQLVRQGHVAFQYDEKKNPLYEFKDLMMLLLQGVSKNNIVKEEHFDSQLVLEDRYVYNFTYNSNDLPVKAALKIGLDEATATQQEVKYTYE
jgi:hypothetical protein